jgi:L-fuculose-phosphate aldolase
MDSTHSIEEIIVYVGKLMFERRLTDIAGGNISCRSGEYIYMTPTGAGHQYHWDIPPQEIICARIDSDELLEHPKQSRESVSHLLVYRAYPAVHAIIHAHPFHALPFCAAGRPIPAVIKSAQVFGMEFGLIEDKPEYSYEQGEEIVARLRPLAALLERQAAALLMPKHGVFIAAANLSNAIDCLECVDTNAYCVLAQKWLP